jgi:AcrR family transcriptional regulator
MCPRSSEQFAELRQRSRTAILDAASELFARKGYAATTTEEIARHAGISKGLIYNHFPSKEAILEVLLESLTEVTLGLPALRGGTVEERLDALITVIRSWFHEIRTNPALVKLGIQFHNDPEMIRIARKRQDAMIATYLETFSSLFSELGSNDPDAETFLLGAVMDGIGLNYHAMPDAVPLHRIEALLIRYYSSLRRVPT